MRLKLTIVILALVLGAGALAAATVKGEQIGRTMGVLTRSADAQIVASDQPGAQGSVTITRVVAPRPSLVVVHSEATPDMPAMMVGYAQVPAGRSENVVVKLDAAKLTPHLIAALHLDAGVRGTFEFDMDRAEKSPDKPYVIDGKPIFAAFSIAAPRVTPAPGVAAAPGAASVEASPQAVVDGSLKIDRVVAPSEAWVLVHLSEGGKPGPAAGMAHVGPGETRDLLIRVDPKVKLTAKVFVALHADRGQIGVFEMDMMDMANSPDQGFVVEGKPVATVVSVR